MVGSAPPLRAIAILLPLLLLLNHPSQAFLLYGCNLSENLCDNNEYCFPDGVFGQCYSAISGAPPPTVLDNLDDTQLKLLELELKRLVMRGKDWGDEQTQCVLAYYKMSMFYQLQYDPEFCQVRKPANVWALVQLIDAGLSEEPQMLNQATNVAEFVDQMNSSPLLSEDEIVQESLNASDESIEPYIESIMNREPVDFAAMSDEQLNKVLQKLIEIREELNEKKNDIGEQEMAVPLDDLDEHEPAVLKKDAEEVGNVNLGLDANKHKIVKGRKDQLTRVDANRVYLKLHLKDDEQLMPLIEFMQNTIALPNNLFFDDFQYENGQLSMRISRFEGAKPKNDKRIDSVEGVASAVYKRRKDIARLSGAEIHETGIGSGSGEESLPVESTDRDWLMMPLLFLSAFTITTLGLVAAMQLMKNRRYYKENIKRISDDMDGGKANLAYQELCRQRADGVASKTSSVSSWGEESSPPSIDISTGHVVLNFLQEYLSEPTKIEAQWRSIKDYQNEQRTKNKAKQFMEQNRSIAPFDDNIVDVEGTAEDGREVYVNASFIYDDDPRQAVYIGAQTPSSSQIAAWWQLIWQHGVCLIVNVSTQEECKQEKNYWPDTGSEVYGVFEIHLVSEHIWSDDYLVRSFYLKNLQTGQTRTITQFHYLSWSRGNTPPSAKSLLEFRRKVNKSYRGRSSAVLVHSWDGAGRVGVYCVVDVLCARLLRGVRQIDVVATVEHLRDQRDGMIATGDQFKLVYGCVAQEVNHLLKTISQ